MKWVLVCCLTFTLFSQDTVMVSEKDEFTGITWFKPYEHIPRFSGMYVYFALTKDSAVQPLRVKFHYFGQDWIFFENVSVITNGNTYNFSFNRYAGHTDVNSGVFETFDFETTEIPDLDRMIQDVVLSGKAKLRFLGEYKHDFELQPFQIALIKKYADGNSKLKKKLTPPDPVIDRHDTSESIAPEKVVDKNNSNLIKFIFFIFVVGLVLSIFFGRLRRNRELERKMGMRNKDEENPDGQ